MEPEHRMASVARYAEDSVKFMADAETELGKGEILQASEKAWGAVAHYVKSVAMDEGWECRTHRQVNHAARRLIRLTDDHVLNGIRLGAANALHQNFYEDWFDEDQVADSLNGVRELLSAMRVARERLSNDP